MVPARDRPGRREAEAVGTKRDWSGGPAVIAGPDASVSGKTSMVVRRLRQLVAAVGVGARIPSERDLAREWGVARMTARGAIDILVKDGELERRPGAGTFVAHPPYAKTLGLTSFTADMRNRGREPSSRVLEFSVRRAGADTAVRLGIDDADRVFRFSRLRLADGEPIAVETNWIPVAIVPDLDRSALEGSLFTILNERYGITPGEATSTIDAVLADAPTAAALGLGERAPCLRIRMDYLDQRLRPLMTSTGLHAGARYQLQVTLGAGAFAAGATAATPSGAR